MKSNSPLPEDQDAQDALAKRIEKFTVQTRRDPPGLPEIAMRISGKSWVLDVRPLGLGPTSMKLEFSRDGSTANLLLADGAISFPIGLDGVFRKSQWQAAGSLWSDGIYASKGSWEDEKTLVIKFIVLEGDLGGEVRLVLQDDRLTCTLFFADAFFASFVMQATAH